MFSSLKCERGYRQRRISGSYGYHATCTDNVKVTVSPAPLVPINNRGICAGTHLVSADDMTGSHNVKCLALMGNGLKSARYCCKISFVLNTCALYDRRPDRFN